MSWQHNISLSSVNQVLWALAVPLPPFFTATYEHLHLFDVSAHVSPSSSAPPLSNRALHQQLTKRLIASLYDHYFVLSNPSAFRVVFLEVSGNWVSPLIRIRAHAQCSCESWQNSSNEQLPSFVFFRIYMLQANTSSYNSPVKTQ